MNSGLDEVVLRLIDEFGHAAVTYGENPIGDCTEYYSAKEALIAYLAEHMPDVNSKD